MKLRGLSAGLIALSILAISVSSTACDLSCALSQLYSNCDHTIHLAQPVQMSMPMQMGGMTHSHHAHMSELGQAEVEATLSSSNTSSCTHHPCEIAATASVQRISPPAPRLGHTSLAVIANLQPYSTHVFVHHFRNIRLRTNLSALDPLSTNLRV